MIYKLRKKPIIIAITKADLFENTTENINYDRYKNGELDQDDLKLAKNVFNSIYTRKE